MTTVHSPTRRRPAPPAPPSRARIGAGVPLLATGVVALVLVAFAFAAWTGVLPFGSDNDEYGLVARSLLDDGTPVVGGVEGTKYPLGYPLLLALFQLLRLPELAPIVANYLLIGATAVVVARTVAQRHSWFAQAAAATFVAVNVALWGTVNSLMPDVLITFLAALLLWAVVRIRSVRGLPLLAAVCFAATSVKTAGVLLAGAASTALLFAEKSLRRWFLLPGAVGLLALGIHTLVVRPYPEPATGYGGKFFSLDPYDESQGVASTGQIISRLWTRWDVVLGDWGEAVVGPHVGQLAAVLVTLALLAAGTWLLGRRWSYGAALVVIYFAGLAVWPFTSVRFGLPMVPLAALGVARLAAAAREPRTNIPRAAATAAVCLALGVHGLVGLSQVANRNAAEAATFGALHENTAEAVQWARRAIPADQAIASPAYRELTGRMQRPVLPVSYTTDPAALWDQTGGRGADWFISYTRLYPRRARLGKVLVRAYPDRFEQVFRNDDVAIFRIVSTAAQGQSPG